MGFTGSDSANRIVNRISKLLRPLGVDSATVGGGGADIGPSVEMAGIPAMSPTVDAERYFAIHHTPADTVERIEPADLARAVASVAVMAYVGADIPGRLTPPVPAER